MLYKPFTPIINEPSLVLFGDVRDASKVGDATRAHDAVRV